MGDGEDGDAGFAGGGVEQPLDVEGFAFGPGGEAGGGGQVVELYGEGEAVLGGEEGIEGKGADAVQAGVLDGVDEVDQGQVASGAPFAVHEVGEEDVLARLDGVGVDANEGEQAGDGSRDAVAHGGGIVGQFRRGGGQRGEDGEGASGWRAGGIDGEFGGGAEAGDAVAVLSPGGEALAPGFGGLSGELVGRDLFARGFVFIHPGAEVGGGELGEGEQEVAHVAFGINDESGDAVNGGFLDDANAEAGFAGAGHADADGVGGEVFGFIQEGFVGGGESFGIVAAAQIKHAQFLEVGHDVSPA